MVFPIFGIVLNPSLMPFYLLGVALYLWIYSSRDNENILFKTVSKKLSIYMSSISFMIVSKDNKGLGPKKNPDPAELKGKPSEKKQIIFIRHGESDWNNVFNKGFNPGLFVRFATAWFQELLMLGKMDSKFLDSPLNFEGIEQALELRKFLSEKQPQSVIEGIVSVMRGESGSSVVVSSCLRRAVATTTLGIWNRIEKTGEKILILSSLQEISRNVDTRALSGPKELVDLPFTRISGHCKMDGSEFNPDLVYDLNDNFGNKTTAFFGIKRLQAFNDWAFGREEDAIIVGGHSLWFRSFFQTFLPFAFNSDAKTKKIENSGVVAFDLHRVQMPDNTFRYRIDENSLITVYKGYTKK